MRLVTFQHEGRRRLGRVEGATVRPLALAGEPVTLEDVLAGGEGAAGRLEADGEALALDGLDHALPIARPGKIFCVGLNYRDHAAEGGHAIPEYPALFTRFANSLVPHGAPLVRPALSDKFDYEAELMVVIGRRAHRLSEDEALGAVFGYTVFNDASVRDYQRKGAQWTPGKNFDGTGAVGPVVVTADEVPAGAHGLAVRTRIGDAVLQDGNTADMIFSVSTILSLISAFATLEPGDLIAMGTPSGVGFARTPRRWLVPGEVCEVSVEGIGVLSNPIIDEA